MKKINLVYEYDYDDVDIALVPNEIADNIEMVVTEFECWIKCPENSKMFLLTNSHGKEVLGIDTKEFIWWLNNVRINNNQTASVLEQHTTYCPQFPMADF